MNELIFILVMAGVGLAFSIFLFIHRKKDKVASIESRYQLLQAKVAQRDQLIQDWYDLHDRAFAKFGTPTVYIGPKNENNGVLFPWDNEPISFSIAGDSEDERAKGIETSLIAIETEHRVPEVNDVAFFWQEQKLAYIGGCFFEPKDIVSVKKATESESDETTVTIVTDDLENPTFDMVYSQEDEFYASQLVNTLSVFRHLK